MLTHSMMFLLLSVSSVEMHCSMRGFSSVKSDKRQCLLSITKANTGAGEARNISAKCRFNSRDDFHYEISWSAPEFTGTPVTGYRVKISQPYNKFICFRLAASERKFLFNASMGLVYGCMMRAYITPLPVVRRYGTVQVDPILVGGCPLPPRLMPLPHIAVDPGSTYSFAASFERDEEPIPRASITWYYSSDIITCESRKRIYPCVDKISITKNGLVLTIENVEESDIGCYVIVANNNISGGFDQQRGYLTLKIINGKYSPIAVNSSSEDVEDYLFAVLTSLLIMSILVFMITVAYRRRRRRRASYGIDEVEKLTTRDVYLSHCITEKNDITLIRQFSDALKNLGINLMVDIFSEVEINNMGGRSRWIAANMKNAEKFIILVTPSFCNNMEPHFHHGVADELKRKIHSELNYLNDFLNDDSCDRVLLVLKGLQHSLPLLFNGRQCFMFPRRFDHPNDTDLKCIVDELLRD